MAGTGPRATLSAMTWVVGMTVPGMAVLVGDIQITTRTPEGDEHHSQDCGLSKIRMIDNRDEGRTLLGFAGGLNAAVALLDSLTLFRRESSSPFEDLEPFLRRWSQRPWTQGLYQALDGLEDPNEAPTALLLHLCKEPMQWGGRVTLQTEGATVTMSPRVGDEPTLEIAGSMYVGQIGSGSGVEAYRQAAQEIIDIDPSFLAALPRWQHEMRGAGAAAIADLLAMKIDPEKHPHVSKALQVLVATPEDGWDGITYTPPEWTKPVPKIAWTLKELEDCRNAMTGTPCGGRLIV
jgi:hypothetical protein